MICDIRIWGTVIVGCSWPCGNVMERLCQDCLATRLLVPPSVSREVTQDMGKWVYGVLPTIITINSASRKRKGKLMGISDRTQRRKVFSLLPFPFFIYFFLYYATTLGFPPPTVSLVNNPGVENSREWGWLQGSVRMEMKGKMKRDPVDPWTSPPLAHSKQWLQNKGTLILSRCCASLVGTCRHACTHGTAQRQVFVRQWERGNAGGSWDARRQSRHRHTHTPQCCNPEILMLCAMAHCRAPWQFTSSLRHTD